MARAKTPVLTRPASLAQVAATLALIATAGTMALYGDKFQTLTLDQASLVSLFLGLGSYAAVVACSSAWSAGSVFLLLVELFHLGLTPFVVFNMPVDRDLSHYLSEWFVGTGAVTALYLSTLAVVSFAGIYLLARGRPAPPSLDEEAEPHDLTYATAGAVLTCCGVTIYLGYIVLIAPQLLFGAGHYSQYVDSLGGDRVLGLAGLAVVIGLVLAAAAPACRARRVALAAFAVFAVLLLLLGVRTAVLFPAAAGVVAAARRHRLPSGVKAAAVVLVGLVVVSLVRDARSDDVSASSINPLSALGETGGTLRPVLETVESPQGPQYGGTYLIPFERLADRVLGGTSESDRQSPTELMASRVPNYQIGYSAVAESYLNFGTAGVPVIFCLLGLALAALDRWRRPGLIPACLTGIAMAGLGLTVRNTFISLPSTIIAGCLALFLVTAWANSRSLDGGPRGVLPVGSVRPDRLR